MDEIENAAASAAASPLAPHLAADQVAAFEAFYRGGDARVNHGLARCASWCGTRQKPQS